MSFELWLIAAAAAILIGCSLFFAARPLFGVLQQEGYSGRALLKWVYRKGNMLFERYAVLSLAALLLSALLSLVFSFLGEAAVLIAVSVYALLGGLFTFSCRRALKVPLSTTPRIIRLGSAFALLLIMTAFALSAGLLAAASAIGGLLPVLLMHLPLTLLPLALPLILSAAGGIMKLYEVPHGKKFIRLAKETLEKSGCVKVGITGSFAKTSVKHYAACILSEKFRVIATPASYNTPLGIAKCVNEQGADCDIFLAEMGARKVGDITELCDMVCPSFAVITGICPQHLETFRDLGNIRKEKGVLAARAEHVVLGASAAGMKEDALTDGRDFGAEEVELSAEGTSFVLSLGGKKIPVKTSLLGRHAAQDLALAAALAYLLGMSPEEIAAAIPKAGPVPHRLELIKSGGVNILDDSYNSNIEGAKNAVETLKLFSGKRYVVTPGLVELGELEEKANYDLGCEFVGLDGVVTVGETRILPVRRGYLEKGGREENLHAAADLAAAQAFLSGALKEGDAVLFLNDLPDKYL